jgi:hypothetical protein
MCSSTAIQRHMEFNGNYKNSRSVGSKLYVKYLESVISDVSITD